MGRPAGAFLHGVRGGAMKIAELMTPDPCCIQRDESLRQAHKLMRTRNVRHLPVLKGDQLVGLVSERDLYLLETLKSVDPAKEPVDQAMTESPFSVAPGARVREVVQEMLDDKYGSAVVVERGRVIGIFTRSDALRALLKLLR
jgi:acetoin utilization protein AcuB